MSEQEPRDSGVNNPEPADVGFDDTDLAAPTVPAPEKPKRSLRIWISYGLFAISAILFAVVLIMYLREDENGNPPPPTAQAGENEMKDVMTSLRDQGLEAEYGRSADRAIGLTEVAQAIVVNGETIYVFIYPDPAQRERDQERLDTEALEIVNTRGTPVATDAPQIISGSNVLIAIYTDDAELHETITAAIEGLS